MRFYEIEANTEKRRECAHEHVFSVCQHTRGLAIVRICRLRANYWQLLQAAGAVARYRARGWHASAEIEESRHMASIHVRITRFSIVHAHPGSGYVYQRNAGTGFRCCNPGARYPYTPSAGGASPGYTRSLSFFNSGSGRRRAEPGKF